MRILYLQPAERFGGAERQGLLLMQRLPELGVEVVPVVGPGQTIRRAMAVAGFESYFFCADIPAEPDARWRLPHRFVEGLTRIPSWRRACRLVATIARRYQVQLILGSRTIGWTISGMVAKSLGLPVVWRAGSRANGLAHHLGLQLLRRSYCPDLVVCNSQAVAADLIPSLGCASVIIPNGVDLHRFAPAAVVARFRSELGLNGRPVIGVAARPGPGKGFELLAEVIGGLRQLTPEVHFLIAGESEWITHYQQLYTRRGLGPAAVTFLGHVHQIEAFYQSCDVVLLTSHQRSIEGLPNALLEAMAMQRPVVAARVGGVAEAITDGVEGLLVAHAAPRLYIERILRLLHDPGLSQRMGRMGRLAVQRCFSAEQTATLYYRAIKLLLTRQGDLPMVPPASSKMRYWLTKKIISTLEGASPR